MRFRAAILDKKLLQAVAKKYGKPVNKIFNNPQVSIHPQKSLEDRANEKLLFQVLKRLPNWGVGRLVVFKQELTNFNEDPTYWRISRVLVDQEDTEMDYGIAWGIFTWNGWCEEYEKEVSRANRHGWRLIPKMDEHLFTNFTPKSKETKEVPLYFRAPPLMSAMWKAKKLKEKSPGTNKEPMIRLLVNRNRDNVDRQRMEDGTLV